jgi:ABC-type uncharacterized transport system ATPase subunit
MNFRSAAGVLVSDVKSRDIKIDSYTLSFHGRLLIEGAEIALNYGQRYGLLGQNGSGKVCFPLYFFFSLLIFYISQVNFSSINRRARYRNSTSYRHLYRPWRSRTF